MGYRIVEHTADVGIEAWGTDLREAFAETARAMFSVMVDLEAVEDRVERRASIHGTDHAALLVAWLNDLLGLVDSEGLVFSSFAVTSLTVRDLVASAFGEPLDPVRHHPHLAVKAATHHDVAIDPGRPAHTKVLLDI